MAFPLEPLFNEELAVQFARKFFGKFGEVKVATPYYPKLQQGFQTYYVGVQSPDGQFMPKGESTHCFADSFRSVGKLVDDTDPIYLRHEVAQLSLEIERAQEPQETQMGLFA